MESETIRYDVADAVATIALDDPETRNALSDAVLDELLDALAAAKADPEVRCVVLTSTHEKVFSSGGNLAGFASERSLVEKHFEVGARFPRVFPRSASSASRCCAPRTGTCSPARSGSRSPAT